MLHEESSDRMHHSYRPDSRADIDEKAIAKTANGQVIAEAIQAAHARLKRKASCLDPQLSPVTSPSAYEESPLNDDTVQEYWPLSEASTRRPKMSEQSMTGKVLTGSSCRLKSPSSDDAEYTPGEDDIRLAKQDNGRSVKKPKTASIMSLAPARRKRIQPETPTEKTRIQTNAKLRTPNGGMIAISDIHPAAPSPVETPGWYPEIVVPNNKFRNERITLRSLQTYYNTYASASGATKEQAEANLLAFLHRISLFDFNGNEKIIIKKSSLLTDGTFTSIKKNSRPDITNIATHLLNRWWAGDTNPNLLRGIHRQRSKSAKTDRKHISYTLDTSYSFHVSSHYSGNGSLHNGQWWPLQICAHRDGAHGEVEAGISGLKAKGAYSIVVSGAGYADIDEGERLQYCGTPSPDASKPSFSTQLMITAKDKGNPLRVLRSAKVGSKYKPKMGLRYDGLYDIKDAEVVEPVTVLYRFLLERCKGQEPICWEGATKRPHQVELDALERDQEMRKLAV